MNNELLNQLYAIHSKSGQEKKIRKFVKRVIKSIDENILIEQDFSGNLLVTKGVADTYPCLASHLDQVQDRHSKDFQCVCSGDVVFGYSPKTHEQQGLGADDKNGIFICLECLRKYDVLKCAFFVGEESGCVGSTNVDLDFFKDCRFIIEPDRRGCSDLITSMYCGQVCSDEFIMALGAEQFGYKEEQGTITDVGTLVERGVGISCLNLSCGYYQAHTDREFCVLSELENCFNFVCHIIENIKEVYPFVSSYKSYYDKYYGYDGYYNYGGYGDYDVYDDDYYYMEELIFGNPDITFEEVLEMGGFKLTDIDILRGMFEELKDYHVEVFG